MDSSAGGEWQQKRNAPSDIHPGTKNDDVERLLAADTSCNDVNPDDFDSLERVWGINLFHLGSRPLDPGQSISGIRGEAPTDEATGCVSQGRRGSRRPAHLTLVSDGLM